MQTTRAPQDIGEEAPAASFPRRAALTAFALTRQMRERRVPHSSPEAVERRQRARIRAMVAHAYEGVPYYRETMRRLGLTPADIASAEDLRKLPLIERAQLQRDPEHFMFEGRQARFCVATRSGGSTSVPVTVVDDLRDLAERSSTIARLRTLIIQLTGKRWRQRIVRIHAPLSSGAILGRAYTRNLVRPLDPRFVELELSMGDGVASNLAAINQFQPDVVSIAGSYAEELFAHALRTGKPFHRPKVVGYGTDALSPGARRMMSEELGIAVLSVYQAIETPQIGFECEMHRGHHLNVDLCPVRIVGADGRDLPPGETGEVVISNLINRTMVLLNYRLGDLAARIPDRCECGRALPLLSFVEGRTAEWLLTAAGDRLHSQILIRPFSVDHEVWGYRVTQRAPGRFEADVVPAVGSDPSAVRARVQERFASIVGPDEELEITFVEALTRTGAGKVRRVVRLNEPDESAAPAPGNPRGSPSPEP